MLTLTAFLDLGWSPRSKDLIADAAYDPSVVAVTATRRDDGRLAARTWTAIPAEWPTDLVGLWIKPPAAQENPDAPPAAQENPDAPPAAQENPAVPLPKLAGKSRTMQALDIIAEEGITPYAAAKRVGISPAAVHRALKARDQLPRCPCCGQALRPGVEVRIPSGPPAFS